MLHFIYFVDKHINHFPDSHYSLYKAIKHTSLHTHCRFGQATTKPGFSCKKKKPFPSLHLYIQKGSFVQLNPLTLKKGR